MSLPFADRPEESSIYQDLKTVTLQDLTPDQFDALKARMFAEGVNGLEDEYRRLLLLGLASDKISTSGPIPDAGKIQIYTQSSDAESALVRPPKGEVWKIQGISTRAVSAPTGSSTYYTFLSSQDQLDTSPAIPTVVNMDLYYSVLTSASQYLPTESIFEEVFQPFLIDHGMFVRLWCDFDGIAAGTDVKWIVGYQRIR